MRAFRAVFVAAAAALSIGAMASKFSDAIPLAAFVGDPDRSQVQLSSDGRVVGFLAPRHGVLNVWVQSIENDALAGEPRAITQASDRSVERWWFVPDKSGASSDVVYLIDPRGDGRTQAWVAPIAGGAPKRLNPGDADRTEFLAVDREHPYEVLLRAGGRGDPHRDVWRFDVRNGQGHVAFRDELGCEDLFVDSSWQVRVATHRDDRGGVVATIRERDDAVWQTFHAWSVEDARTSRVVSLSRDGREVYVVDSGRPESLPTGGLCAVSAAPDGPAQRWRVLAASSRCEPGAVVVDPTDGRPLGVRFTYERPWMKAMDPQFEEDVIAIRKLSTGELRVEGASDDGALLLVSFTFERSDDEYWLFRRARGAETSRGTRLFAARDALSGAEFGPRSVATVQSRDGVPLVVYHSAPRGYDLESPTPVPMVVLLHDCRSARADWDFDPVAAWLGELGYATLAVNVRGSVGFGKRWRALGDTDDVGAKANDVIDALDWAIAGRFADPTKVAMLGAGEGGTLAIELLARAPERFVGGVSIGTRISPSTGDALGGLARPLLIAHGKNDATCPCVDVENALRALGDRGRLIATWYGADEGHEIARSDRRVELYEAVRRFLADHMGNSSRPFAPPLGVDAPAAARKGS